MKKTIAISFLCLLFTVLWAVEVPAIHGWSLEGEAEIYHPDNLWELINGAADAFVSYGFQELHYFEVSRENMQYAVHIFDMGSPLNAFGMYRSENPFRTDAVDIGTETQFSDYLAVMLKGNYYVKVETIKGKTLRKNSESLLKDIATSLAGDSSFPKELQHLPSEHRLPHSESFILENFLGIKELSHCIFARYRENDLEYRVFIILPREGRYPDTLEKALQEKWQPQEWMGTQYFHRKIPYTGVVGILETKNRLIGIADIKEENTMKEILSRFLH